MQQEVIVDEFGSLLSVDYQTGGGHADVQRATLLSDLKPNGMYQGNSIGKGTVICLKSAKAGDENNEVLLDNERRVLQSLVKVPEIINYHGCLTTSEDERVTVMEWVGEHMGNVVRTKHKDGLPDNLLDTYVSRVCAALTQVHTLGEDDNKLYLHRDIKPDNIFVTEQGLCKLGDFSCVGTSDDGDGTGIGTYNHHGAFVYCAPELIFAGKGRHLREHTVQSEIYSVGVLALYLASGSTPFTIKRLPKGTEEQRAIKENMKKIGGYVDGLSIPVNKKKAILAALDPKRSNRPGSIEDFLGLFMTSGLTKVTQPKTYLGPKTLDVGMDLSSPVSVEAAPDLHDIYEGKLEAILNQPLGQPHNLTSPAAIAEMRSLHDDIVRSQIDAKGLVAKMHQRYQQDVDKIWPFIEGNRARLRREKPLFDELFTIADEYGNTFGNLFSTKQAGHYQKK